MDQYLTNEYIYKNISLIKILREQSITREDVRVAHGRLDTLGDRHTTKWIKISQATDDFLSIVNLRELWYDEIVLDYDNKDFNGDATSKVAETIMLLYDAGYSFVCWKTNSNGFHIHLQFPEMLSMSNEERKEIRRWFIKKYNADPNKISGLISIETSLHWKSKQLMKLVAVV